MWVERHQDYSFIIPLIPAGQAAIAFPCVLDTDADFSCRARGLRVTPNLTTRRQTQVQELRFRYTNENGAYLSTQPIQTPQDFAFAFGEQAVYRPVKPEIHYRAGQTVTVDVYNDSGVDVVNLQVFFRGVKLFAPGTYPAPTYPQNCRPLDFTYQSGKGTPTDPQIVMPVQSDLYQQLLQVQGDADFVLRAGQAGSWSSLGPAAGSPYSGDGYTNLFMQLMDSRLKPYSNRPIHIDWLMGNAGGNSGPSPSETLGNSAPGTFFPEIYLRKNEVMYFNLFRRDTPWVPVTDGLPVRLSFAWIGSKVYA